MAKHIHITNHLTFYTLTPISEEAKAWVDSHLPEDRQTLGNQIYIEGRYMAGVVSGLKLAGLLD